MNEEENSNQEPSPAAMPRKLDRKTLLIMAAFIGGLVLLVVFNMK